MPALDQHLARPVIASPQRLLGGADKVFDLDCCSASDDALERQSCGFRCRVSEAGRFHGLAVWFNCELLPDLAFTTGPEEATHWEQTLLFVDPASMVMDLQLEKGDTVEGELRWLVQDKDLAVAMVGQVTSEGTERTFGRRLDMSVV
ncbi:unnamed protein product [Effrenium voratum]|nr:unnamed protein product [Effrenium voratum]